MEHALHNFVDFCVVDVGHWFDYLRERGLRQVDDSKTGPYKKALSISKDYCFDPFMRKQLFLIMCQKNIREAQSLCNELV